MQVSWLNHALLVAGDAGLAAVLAVLYLRGLIRSFPIFTLYTVYGLVTDVAGSYLVERLPPVTYFKVYFVLSVLQSLLGFGVLFEIGANVLRPVKMKRSMPAGFVWVFVVIAVLATAVSWILSSHASQAALTAAGQAFVTINVVFAVLTVVFFLAIAAFAQVLGISWRNHVLQLATGLAFYSAISLVVELAHSHLVPTSGNAAQYAAQYRNWDQIRSIGYLCTVAFWGWSLAQKEAPRKEFSPQMASFLVSIADTAKRNRTAFVRPVQK